MGGVPNVSNVTNPHFFISNGTGGVTNYPNSQASNSRKTGFLDSTTLNHLDEANLGYIAAPSHSRHNPNIDVINVDSPTNQNIIEPARVTSGGIFSTTIDAVRPQAPTHRLTESNFHVNHPENYLGYVLALAADQPAGDTLTHLGADIVRFARDQHGSIAAALAEFPSWKGRSIRFNDLAA